MILMNYLVGGMYRSYSLMCILLHHTKFPYHTFNICCTYYSPAMLLTKQVLYSSHLTEKNSYSHHTSYSLHFINAHLI